MDLKVWVEGWWIGGLVHKRRIIYLKTACWEWCVSSLQVFCCFHSGTCEESSKWSQARWQIWFPAVVFVLKESFAVFELNGCCRVLYIVVFGHRQGVARNGGHHSKSEWVGKGGHQWNCLSLENERRRDSMRFMGYNEEDTCKVRFVRGAGWKLHLQVFVVSQYRRLVVNRRLSLNSFQFISSQLLITPQFCHTMHTSPSAFITK